ncbi:hypothetical protein MP638_005981 [Amoeboaphelidium occidentale]|nr:hypothetical protein MP638_005981 [Amoeboaphelidium occidentale]
MSVTISFNPALLPKRCKLPETDNGGNEQSDKIINVTQDLATGNILRLCKVGKLYDNNQKIQIDDDLLPELDKEAVLRLKVLRFIFRVDKNMIIGNTSGQRKHSGYIVAKTPGTLKIVTADSHLLVLQVTDKTLNPYMNLESCLLRVRELLLDQTHADYDDIKVSLSVEFTSDFVYVPGNLFLQGEDLEMYKKIMNTDNALLSSGADAFLLETVEELTKKRFNELSVPPTIEKSFNELTNLKLFKYQQKTVCWMISRENDRREIPQKLFNMKLNRLNCNYYYHQSILSAKASSALLCKGGMLCDRMGMGKTIEILMLIMLNPFKLTDVEHEAHETSKVSLFKPSSSDVTLPKIKATLIVCPATIIQQWKLEIDQKLLHPAGLKVLIYANKDMKFITESTLMEYDVILVDFATLRREVHFTRPDQGRGRRFPREYEKKKSPLIKVCFWRIVIDEAQLVGSHSLIHEVTSAIQRVNSWVVTGTPLVANDLRNNLVLLLSQLSNLNYVPNDELLMHCVQSLMHRNSDFNAGLDANDTTANFQLPALHECIHYLGKKRNDVEKKYYKQLLDSASSSIFSSDEPSGVEISQWVLRLRQTCVHLQLGAYNQQKLGASPRSLPELLYSMRLNQHMSYFQQCRKVMDVEFKIGGLYEYIKEYKVAEEIYVQILKDIDEQIEVCKKEYDDAPESLSLITKKNYETAAEYRHRVLFALASVYLSITESMADEDVEKQRLKTESDRLFEEAEKTRQFVTSSAEQGIDDAKKQMAATYNAFEYERKKYLLKPIDESYETSFIRVGTVAFNLRQAYIFLNKQLIELEELRKAIFVALEKSDVHNNYAKDSEEQDIIITAADKFKLELAVRRLIITELDTSNFSEQRERYIEELIKIRTHVVAGSEEPDEFSPEAKKLNELRTKDGTEIPHSSLGISSVKLNEIINYDEIVSDDEDDSEKQDDEEENFRVVQANPAEIAAAKEITLGIKEDIKSQASLMQNLEKDSASFSKVLNWRIQFYRRLQKLSDNVKLPEDVVDPLDEIEDYKEKARFLKLAADQALHSLRYLNSLSHSDETGQSDGTTACAICQEKVGSHGEVVVTECCHLFCRDCLHSWLRIKRTCPMCTSKVAFNKIQVVRAQGSSSNGKRQRDFKPDLSSLRHYENYRFPENVVNQDYVQKFGTKIGTIVSHIRYLSDMYAHDFKCLVFSQWEDSIALIEKALDAATIPCLHFNKKTLGMFKTDPKFKVLLLNAKSQNSGLTLVECNHVFLVEPNFTVASELQAVARINRVGQTRETYSHRYIMEGTIEEQIIIDRHGKSVFGSGAKQDADSNWLLSMLENELNRA